MVQLLVSQTLLAVIKKHRDAKTDKPKIIFLGLSVFTLRIDKLWRIFLIYPNRSIEFY